MLLRHPQNCFSQPQAAQTFPFIKGSEFLQRSQVFLSELKTGLPQKMHLSGHITALRVFKISVKSTVSV